MVSPTEKWTWPIIAVRVPPPSPDQPAGISAQAGRLSLA
jgi:hypothetical protein